MKKLINGFEHRMGSHCGSTLMSNILRYYGYDINEDLCYGIGSGLGFLYRKSWNPAFYMVLGRSHDIEDKISRHLGFYSSSNIVNDNETAWQEVKCAIDAGIPVLADLDASLIPYLREKFNMFDHVRYGGHRVCVVGYDTDKNKVFLSDYAWGQLQEVELEDFKNARGSDINEFPSRNLYFTFFFPKELIPLEEAVIKGLGFNVHNMLYPTTRQTGLMGMDKFIRQVRYWTYENQDDHVMKNAYITYMMLETVGTGGGNFRRIYARFMKQTAELFKDDAFLHLSKDYSELADNWTYIAKLLLKSSKDIKEGIFAPNDNKVEDMLKGTYEKEEECILKIKDRIESQYDWAGYKFYTDKG